MDMFSASAAATATATITAYAPPLSIASVSKRISVCRRHLHLVTASSKHGDEPDLSCDDSNFSIVPFFKSQEFLAPLSNDAAMGLVLRAAAGNGWTTDSGMEGPSLNSRDADLGTVSGQASTYPWSLFTKSPRRRMRVAFTCNVCGQRTTRAINPRAYTDGTVFVQCCGCNVFHKLVDNLNLFHEMKCYVNPTFHYKGDVQFKLDDNEDDDSIFPVL